jgi:2-C-methyl-D-erythritol 4-phosphate cytidylyltransferase
MSDCAIIVAAGKSVRFGDTLPKQFHEVAGKPLLAWTIAAFERAASIDQIVVVVSPEFELLVTQKIVRPYGFSKVIRIVEGGESRRQSVYKALKSLSSATGIVAIHDGVRPLVLPGDIDRVVESAKQRKAAMLAVRSKETVKEVNGDTITSTIEREKIWLAQTPQAFEYQLIMNAHQAAENQKNDSVTDDSILVEQMGVKVKVIEPLGPNIKVTTPDEMSFVETVLRKRVNG